MDLVLYHATWCPFCRAFLPAYRRLAPQGKDVVLDDENDPRWEGIDVVPTVIAYDGAKEVRRLVAKAGIGLGEEEFRGWLTS